MTQVQPVISGLEVVVGQKRHAQARFYGRRPGPVSLIEPRRTIGSWTCEVQVDDQVADEAARLLERMSRA